MARVKSKGAVVYGVSRDTLKSHGKFREKFSLPSVILDAKRVKDLAKIGKPNPLGRGEGIIILSYEYAARIADQLRGIPWNLVVFDEAHKLRNVYRAIETSRAAVLRDALVGRQKLLLTATPLQNNLMELYGLVTIIDVSPSPDWPASSADHGSF